jgi:hypothetical protein
LVGAPLLAVRLAITFIVSVASYHLVEKPIRTGELGRRLSRWAGSRRWALLPVLGAATAGVLLTATVSTPGTVALATNTAAVVPARPEGEIPAVAPRSPGPIRILLVGDSTAVTLAFGLDHEAPRNLNIQLDGVVGCGLVTQGEVNIQGMNQLEAGGWGFDRRFIRCNTWPKRWSNDVARFNPDVAVMLDGPWEVRDRKIDGTWTHIGEPGFDRMEENALETAVRVLGSRGARVVLLTCPYISEPEKPDGMPWPADDPRRMDLYNDLLRKVAAQHPHSAKVIGLGAYLSPGGHFASVIDGVDVRDADGIHLTLEGGMFVQRWLLPQLDSIGLSVRRTDQVDPTGGRSRAPAPA